MDRNLIDIFKQKLPEIFKEHFKKYYNCQFIQCIIIAQGLYILEKLPNSD